MLTAILWSISSIASARAGGLLGSTTANRLRLAISLAALALMLALAGGSFRCTGWEWFLASGAIGLGLGDSSMFAAYDRLGARLTVLMTQCLAVPVAWLLEWGWLGAEPTWKEIGWCALILGGVAMALAPGQGQRAPLPSSDVRGAAAVDGAARPRTRLLLGVAFGLGSALGLGVAAVLARRGYQHADLHGVLDGVSAGFWRNAGGLGLMAGMWMVPLPGRRGADGARVRPAWRLGAPWLVLTALVGPCLGVVCYQLALSTAKAGAVHAVLAITPILVIPLAWVIDGDRPRPRSLLGGAVAVAGAVGMALA